MMPDLCMCNNHACPIRTGCYRFTAQPDKPYQTYAHFNYTVSADRVTCNFFITRHDYRRIEHQQRSIQKSYHKRWKHLSDG